MRAWSRTLGEICDRAELPHGSAVGLGLWVWCVPAGDSNLIWGIPFANFFAWGVIVLGVHLDRDRGCAQRLARTKRTRRLRVRPVRSRPR